MKVIYDQRFQESAYADDNAAAPGRMEAAMAGLRDGPWDLVSPFPATREDLLVAHEADYLDRVAEDGPRFAMASLAAGGAILAARTAHGGEPAFACVRPPGHHASPGQAWGHCTFSNLALGLLVLRAEQRIASAFVLDFDAHTGDGTARTLAAWPQAVVFNPYADNAPAYLACVRERLEAQGAVDMMAVSAGFDSYLHDAGHKLDTPDFAALGALVREASLRLCRGRRFAVLEGGYHLPALGANVLAFCRGFA
jgi:acetoin utilization deacetylase AcuC-like enzyme